METRNKLVRSRLVVNHKRPFSSLSSRIKTSKCKLKCSNSSASHKGSHNSRSNLPPNVHR